MLRKFVALCASLVAVAAIAGCGGTHTRTVVRAPKAFPPAAAIAQQLNKLTPTLHGGRYRAAGFGQPPVKDYGLKKQNLTLGASGLLQGYDTAGSDYIYIPYGAAVAGCYVGGTWADNCSGVRGRGVKHVFTIATSPGVVARVYDDEPGNGYPSYAGPWLRMVLAHGVKRPGIYADSAWMPAIEQSAAAYGIPHCSSATQTYCYLRWLADWDNLRTLPYGMDAKQYASASTLDYDVFSGSAWFPSKSKPKPKPKPVENYEWFCHSSPAAGLICGPFRSPWGLTNERSDVHLYDTARAKSQSGTRLRYEFKLREELHWLAQRLNAVARRSPSTFNDEWHRYGRVDCLLDRAMDNRVTSWASCIAWGKTHNTSRWLR